MAERLGVPADVAAGAVEQAAAAHADLPDDGWETCERSKRLAAVAVAVLISSSNGGGFTDIDAGNARDQAGDLIQYVRDHLQR